MDRLIPSLITGTRSCTVGKRKTKYLPLLFSVMTNRGTHLMYLITSILGTLSERKQVNMWMTKVSFKI